MKNLTFWLLVLFLVSCAKQDIPDINNNNNTNNKDDYYYLDFHVTCFKDGNAQPAFYNVLVFDCNKKKLISGNTNPNNGRFTSLGAVCKYTDEIRIEFWHVGGSCATYYGFINGGTGMSPENSPLIFRKKDETYNWDAEFRIGDCSQIETDDVWGP
jgi:hypothetical protein